MTKKEEHTEEKTAHKKEAKEEKPHEKKAEPAPEIKKAAPKAAPAHAREHGHAHVHEPRIEAKAEKKEQLHEKKAGEKHVARPGEKPAVAVAPATAAPPHAAGKKHKKARKKPKVALARGKRKEAIARAAVSPGKGRFVFNRTLFDAIPNRYIREIVKEPLNFLGAELGAMDINVYVRGGGQMGQAQAARTAIAKALVEYTQDEKLKNAYLEHDRSLLVEDVRRVEPKKYKGPKARARFQKSYR